MALNIIGANENLAASSTNTQISVFAQSQYNPVPWPATLWALGQALPGPTVSDPRTVLNLSIAGTQIAQTLTIPTSEWSPMFSQFVRVDLQAGQTWQMTIDNVEAEIIPVRLAVYLYHPGPNGEQEPMPNFLV